MLAKRLTLLGANHEQVFREMKEEDLVSSNDGSLSNPLQLSAYTAGILRTEIQDLGIGHVAYLIYYGLMKVETLDEKEKSLIPKWISLSERYALSSSIVQCTVMSLLRCDGLDVDMIFKANVKYPRHFLFLWKCCEKSMVSDWVKKFASELE